MAVAPQKTTTTVVPRKTRGERSLFSSSDDTVMMKQIVATHAHDGREFAVRPLLQIIEEIFNRAAAHGVTSIVQYHGEAHEAQLDTLDEKAHENGLLESLEVLCHTINRVSCEISCKCSGGGDAHTTTLAIFNTLSSYSWDAKVVLALAAFAVNYGEFWLVAQLYLTHPLAKGVALLKQLPEVLERTEAMKPRFDSLGNLIKAMMDVTKCIVEFKELPSVYINPDTPEMITATAHIPTAVYWTIRSIVSCASQIAGLTGMGYEYVVSTTEAWELSSLAHKVTNIYNLLSEQLTLCYHHINENKLNELFQTIIRISETVQIDNMKFIRALIYAKDDQLPLFDGSTKQRVSLDVLRRKNVLLFISDLDLSHDELFILEQMYSEARQNPTRQESQYDVVWIPVVDRSTPWNDTKQKQFETFKSTMSWYSVYHPSLLDPAVIKYIKEIWHFIKKPLLVVLDPQGRVTNLNAIHMMWIWGSLAYPFSSAREEALWKEETWRMELFVDSIDPNILVWIAEGKHICLFGGEDIEWIRKFSTTARQVAQAAGIALEMLYVGKSNPREKVRKNNTIILEEKLGHILPDVTLIWFFWVRLESMWHSKVQHKRSIENDPIMREIMTMLSFDGSDQGWAVISKGSAEMAKAKGETILKSFVEFDLWKHTLEEKEFVPALNDYLHGLHTPLHCNRLILPGASGMIPERIICSECGRSMEKFIMYRCCTD